MRLLAVVALAAVCLTVAGAWAAPATDAASPTVLLAASPSETFEAYAAQYKGLYGGNGCDWFAAGAFGGISPWNNLLGGGLPIALAVATLLVLDRTHKGRRIRQRS